MIAIDETGSFDASSPAAHFFVAVHLRQYETIYDAQRERFMTWEGSLDRSLKNARGEIKGSALSDAQLFEFARKVVCSHYPIRITPVMFRPAENPVEIVGKHRTVLVLGTQEISNWYADHGNRKLALTYQELSHWIENLNHQQFLKILILGICIYDSFVNTIGHAISGGHDDELLRIALKIDRDFIREPQTEKFWREILRSLIYHRSVENPVPLLTDWTNSGHPFLDKYRADGALDFRAIFQEACSFERSHEHFEIRIADGVSTIFSRHFNLNRCSDAYDLIRHCITADGHVPEIRLNDFDLVARKPRWV